MNEKRIKCAWCGKKRIIIKAPSTGLISVICDKCFNPNDVDLDKETASKGKIIKYA